MTFEDQHPIALSAKYGCYFSHPGAQTELAPEYHKCGWETIERTSSADPQDDKYQRAVNVHLSGMCKTAPEHLQ